jgi:hypothetical protein
MLSANFIEYIGYAASACIVISLVMTSIIKLRIINSIGCLLFVIYGSYTGAYPVVISNAIIILINIYYLYKLTSKSKND